MWCTGVWCVVWCMDCAFGFSSSSKVCPCYLRVRLAMPWKVLVQADSWIELLILCCHKTVDFAMDVFQSDFITCKLSLYKKTENEDFIFYHRAIMKQDHYIWHICVMHARQIAVTPCSVTGTLHLFEKTSNRRKIPEKRTRMVHMGTLRHVSSVFVFHFQELLEKKQKIVHLYR